MTDQPTTAAGRALLDAIRSAVLDPSIMKLLGRDGREQLVALVSLKLIETDILAIEAEARASLCDATNPTETWGLMWCGLFYGHPRGGVSDGHRWFSPDERPDRPDARASLDVDRLARAMDTADVDVSGGDHEDEDHEDHLAYARELAPIYARLALEEPRT
jgi:hypothetical protein